MLLDLFAGTGVLDKMADVDDALVAGVGVLQASVVRLLLSNSTFVDKSREPVEDSETTDEAA